jgi:hypothetical protein
MAIKGSKLCEVAGFDPHFLRHKSGFILFTSFNIAPHTSVIFTFGYNKSRLGYIRFRTLPELCKANKDLDK